MNMRRGNGAGQNMAKDLVSIESELQGHLQLEHCAVFQHFMVCIYMNVSLLW
jgi:hypothetical protein